LFVCMGNICRSPAAQTLMEHAVGLAKWDDRIECDSAGTIDYHRGKAPDARMQEASARRGIPLSGAARQVEYADLQRFDLVVAMDRANLGDLRALDSTGRHAEKIRLFTDFCTRLKDHDGVPDPYYGGVEGFDLVLDLLEDGCEGILKEVQAKLGEP